MQRLVDRILTMREAGGRPEEAYGISHKVCDTLQDSLCEEEADDADDDGHMEIVKMEDKSKDKLSGAQKRKPSLIRRYVREVKGSFKRTLHGFGGGGISGSDSDTITAEDVFKACKLELPVGDVNGRLGWRVGPMPSSHLGELGQVGAYGLQEAKGMITPYAVMQNEAFDLSFKPSNKPDTMAAVEEPDEVVVEGTGVLWDDPRQREALGDFVYAAAMASHFGQQKTQEGVSYERFGVVQEQLAHSISSIPFRGERSVVRDVEYCVPCLTDPDVYPGPLVTSSGDVLNSTGHDQQYHDEPSSSSSVFVQSKQHLLHSEAMNSQCAHMPELHLSARQAELSLQIPIKRPRGRPRQNPHPFIQSGGPSSSEVSTTMPPTPKRGRPKGSTSHKVPFCGAKTCQEHEERTKRLRDERRAAAKSMRQFERRKRLVSKAESPVDRNSCRPGQSQPSEDSEFTQDEKFGPSPGLRRTTRKPKQIRYRTERPFICPHCPGSFTLRSNMERHGKQQHPTLWMPSPSLRLRRRKSVPQKTDLNVYWDENTIQY